MIDHFIFEQELFKFYDWRTQRSIQVIISNFHEFRNLPRAIFISLPLVTAIYVLANVAYLGVLTPTEMLASDAIAVTVGDKMLGPMAWVMPVFVAMSAFGGLSVHIMTSSRLCFVGARQGHFPDMLALINIDRMTPAPSLIFLVCWKNCLFIKLLLTFFPHHAGHSISGHALY